MSDLRKEAFISNRLAETPKFGQHDVEEWLAREREADRPHIPEEPAVPLVSQWQRLPGSDLLGLTDPLGAQGILRGFATRVGDFGIEDVAPKIGDWRPFAQLIGTHVDGVRIYVGYWAFVILMLGRYFYILRVWHGIERGAEEEGIAAYPFSSNADRMSRAVADVLLGEWARGGRKAREARNVLCDAVERRVHEERVQAERDFDTAVAVSEDGTKIVHADWVVVVQRDDMHGRYVFHAHHGRDFKGLDRKIHRSPTLARVNLCMRYEDGFFPTLMSVVNLVADRYRNPKADMRRALCGMEGSLLAVTFGTERETRIYVAREQDCPGYTHFVSEDNTVYVEDED